MPTSTIQTILDDMIHKHNGTYQARVSPGGTPIPPPVARMITVTDENDKPSGIIQ